MRSLIDQILQAPSRSCVVLSPHSDDAALSVPCTLWAAIAAGVRVTLVTCFSVSDYRLGGRESLADVTNVRKNEDLAFQRVTGSEMKLVWLDLLDAPLRGYDNVFVQHSPRDWDDVLRQHMRDALESHIHDGCWVIAPLALGGHVDHLIVHDMSLDVMSRREIGIAFYEDLPYACSWGPEAVATRLSAVAERSGVEAVPIGVTCEHADRIKRSAAACYPSQFDKAVVVKLEEYMAQTMRVAGVAERLWLLQPSDAPCPVRGASEGLD